MANVVSTLALAYVASYIFHVVGDLWNRREENEQIQIEVEKNILELFNVFRKLASGMRHQLGRTDDKPFHFDTGDNVELSYDWDKFLSTGHDAAHFVAQRMFSQVYYQYMECQIELGKAKERLSGEVTVRLMCLDAIMAKVRDAIGSPRMHGQNVGEQQYHMNLVGDKINELHAELSFFKAHLRSKWKCKNPKLEEFLMQENESYL